MIWLLWKYLLEDDLPSFQQTLATGGAAVQSQRGTNIGQEIATGSPHSLSTSPTLARNPIVPVGRTAVWNRTDLNRRDPAGLTLLHVAASSRSDSALGFVDALLEQPQIDLYVQDLENGWTALHRAFYFGNIAIARNILRRENQDALHLGSGGVNHRTGGLIKIQDLEGNGPLDLYAATVMDRSLKNRGSISTANSESADDFLSSDDEQPDMDQNEHSSRRAVHPTINIQGDEAFTFGSNKNITLGFGDEDDRQHPEGITLVRPEHLLHRFHREHSHKKKSKNSEEEDIPAIIRHKPLLVQNIEMAKLHTAVLTTDPESNLYVCGHGPGGRLGLGDERTRYRFACVENGALSKKKVVAVALGQNHTLAISDNGDIFSWGMNGFGQLGYPPSDVIRSNEEPVQLEPRQIFNPLKKEIIIGVAASRIHSVAFTSDSLYTFGKNEGQLGLMDSDARSLAAQHTPRKVASSLFRSAIASVSAIDRATICLLASHEVWVFANYGYVKLNFDLGAPSSDFFKQAFMVTRYDKTPNVINKITSGGNTICAMSSTGEVYTCNVSQPVETAGSTTAPGKIRDGISKPVRVWSLRKRHMAARDVAVDHDGSIILSTDSGSVWKSGTKLQVKNTNPLLAKEDKRKGHRFSRVSGLTRVVAVRASSQGAYAAVRKDCDVTRKEIHVDSQTIYQDVHSLLSFKYNDHDGGATGRLSSFSKFTEDLIKSKTLEEDVAEIIGKSVSEALSPYDMELRSSKTKVHVPVHSFILAGRSPVLRHALRQFHSNGPFELAGLLTIESTPAGPTVIVLQDMDLLTLLNLAHFLYTDYVLNVWDYPLRSGRKADKEYFMEVRSELMKLAARLEIPDLEVNARLMTMNSRLSLCRNLEDALASPDYLKGGDLLVRLSDGEMLVHRALVCERCPYFETLFQGRSEGLWLQGRMGDSSAPISVDLTEEVDCKTFGLVLRHIYGDAGHEIFDEIVADDLDEFLDCVMGVLIAAEYLMLKRLLQICQEVIGHYVNARNVSQLINDIAASSVPAFKEAGLEYICLNLEAVLHNRALDELDEELFPELDQVVRDNQRSYLRYARGEIVDSSLIDKHPELLEAIDKARHARINSMKAPVKQVRPESSRQTKTRRMSSNMGREAQGSPAMTPRTKSEPAAADLMFEMDEMEDGTPESSRLARTPAPRSSRGPEATRPENPWQTPKQSGPRRTSEMVFGSPSPHAIGSPLVMHGSNPSAGPSTPKLPSTPKPPGRPWGAVPLPGPKQDLKDILAQAPGQKSNIALGLAAQADKPYQAPVVVGAKMSQKERKKSQAQQQASPAQSPNMGTPDAKGKGSPWRSVSSGAKVSLNEIQSATSSTPALPTPPAPTFARPPKQAPRPPVQAPRGKSFPSSSKTAAVEPSLQLTMADILAQQQAEKEYIKEYAAKRDLKDIQTEQEFELWWEKESRKVQGLPEEPQATPSAGPGRGGKKGAPSRRGRRGRRGGANVQGKEGANTNTQGNGSA